MKLLLAPVLLTLCGLFVAPLLPALAAGNQNLTDQPLNAYVNFAGLRTRIDKIETVKSPDGRPILEKAGGTAEGTGYIMVTVSLQNPSTSQNIGVPGNDIGFEVADGTQIDETSAQGFFLLPSLNAVPDSLHPKQHIQVVYVITGWNGQDITKMFLKKNSGYSENDAGFLYARFQIPKGYVKQLDAVATPSPSPEP